MLTEAEFIARFRTWFEFPQEILSGNPSDVSQTAAAKALHREIIKSNSEWFRALASRRVGTIGNWCVILGYVAALARQAATMMQAAQPAPAQPGPAAAEAPWPPKV